MTTKLGVVLVAQRKRVNQAVPPPTTGLQAKVAQPEVVRQRGRTPGLLARAEGEERAQDVQPDLVERGNTATRERVMGRDEGSNPAPKQPLQLSPPPPHAA